MSCDAGLWPAVTALTALTCYNASSLSIEYECISSRPVQPPGFRKPDEGAQSAETNTSFSSWHVFTLLASRGLRRCHSQI
ncbi:hypothetical protein VTN96DRAFT_2560 [Rasamsonia emersonii]